MPYVALRPVVLDRTYLIGEPVPEVPGIKRLASMGLVEEVEELVEPIGADTQPKPRKAKRRRRKRTG